MARPEAQPASAPTGSHNVTWVVDSRTSLVERIDAALPQTQCRRCGYDDCKRYAEAVAVGAAGINLCPPGGAQGIARLAELVGAAPIALDPTRGAEGPLRNARIDEATCIGCTLCLDACPVDCIIGGPKSLHIVIETLCTGCELCLPACPVDCIVMHVVNDGMTGWRAWSEAQASQSRQRYAIHQCRLGAAQPEPHTDSGASAPSGSNAGGALPSSSRGRPSDFVAAALTRVHGRRAD